MGRTKDSGRNRDLKVSVIDGEIPSSGWQQVDLDGRLSRLGTTSPVAAPASPRPAASWSVSTTIVSAARQPILAGGAVPMNAFVKVGRAGRFGKRGRHQVMRDAKRAVANDNVATGPARSVWRDVFFLAILAATVVAAFWSGRVHGLQKVIVVPGPSSFHSVVT